MNRVQQAVDDLDWQRFRVSLKRQSTETKLSNLKSYYDFNVHPATGTDVPGRHDGSDCNICIRIDNYIKALCRGGQLFAGESLQTALENDWKLRIKS